MKQQGNFLLLEIDEFRDWLKQQKITRKITTLQVHHTWLPNYTTRKNQDPFKCLEGMRNSHLANGWKDIGQNITILENQVAISLGRGLNVTPAGITGFNTENLCIEIVGNFDIGGDKLTDIQKKSIIHTYACLAEKLNIPIDTEHIVYHHWFSSKGVKIVDFKTGKSISKLLPSKTCPGTNFFNDGNTVVAANKTFIPMIKQEFTDLNKQKVVEELVKSLSKNFNDVYKQWQVESIDQGVDRGLFAVGVDKKFNPDEKISRAEVAVIISRLVNKILDGSLK